jgi:hypothetical protein
MTRGSSSEAPDTLLHDVIDESKNSSGTWSLAMHTRITAFLGGATPDEVTRFVDGVTKELISPECGSPVRFKLAQLCTTVRRTYPAITPRFTEFHEELSAIASRTEDPLDGAISKLLRSLFEPLNPTRTIPRPFTNSSCRTMLVSARRPSRTPQPS